MKVYGDESFLVFKTNRSEVHNLRNLLGSEAKGGWIIFMNELSKELPFLLKKGRPNAHSINISIIGQTGYETWLEFLTNELGWNESKWRTYRSAYKYIIKYDYLRNIKPNSSEIISISKKLDIFPTTEAEWFEGKLKVQTQTSKDKLETLSNCNKQLRILTEILDSVRKSSDKIIGSLNNKLNVVEKTNKSLMDEAIVKQKTIEKNYYNVVISVRDTLILLASLENKCNEAESWGWWKRITKRSCIESTELKDVKDNLNEIFLLVKSLAKQKSQNN